MKKQLHFALITLSVISLLSTGCKKQEGSSFAPSSDNTLNRLSTGVNTGSTSPVKGDPKYRNEFCDPDGSIHRDVYADKDGNCWYNDANGNRQKYNSESARKFFASGGKSTSNIKGDADKQNAYYDADGNYQTFAYQDPIDGGWYYNDESGMKTRLGAFVEGKLNAPLSCSRPKCTPKQRTRVVPNVNGFNSDNLADILDFMNQPSDIAGLSNGQAFMRVHRGVDMFDINNPAQWKMVNSVVSGASAGNFINFFQSNSSQEIAAINLRDCQLAGELDLRTCKRLKRLDVTGNPNLKSVDLTGLTQPISLVCDKGCRVYR